MPTNDERHEIAARLRDFDSLRPTFKESIICGFLDVLNVDYLDWEGICNRLADLIEPEPENATHMYRDEHGTWHCKSCENGGDNITGSNGELDMWYDSWHPNYCPWCGARVVEE